MKNLELYNKLIRKTICREATDEEFETFMHLAKQYNLDPIKKELYFIKKGSTPATMFTSRDGYLKIAHNSGQFDGLESDAVYDGDKLTKRPDGSFLIEYGKAHLSFDKSQLRGAFCNVYRKDWSKATSFFVSYEDYNKAFGENPWKKYPNAMITKVAESMSLKRAFAISGLTTKEEILTEELPDDVAGEQISLAEAKRLLSIAIKDKNIAPALLMSTVANVTGKTKSDDLDTNEILFLTEYIKAMEC